MAEVLARIAVAVLALAVVAALAVELVTHDILANAAGVAAQPHPTAKAVDAQLRDLKRVEKYRPGAGPFLAAAALELRTARDRSALRSARRAAEREPENFSAWVTLAVASERVGDRGQATVAYARAHALNPLYPIPR
jgi:predicted Zn-dependent protease